MPDSGMREEKRLLDGARTAARVFSPPGHLCFEVM
jgi:hypothetical protein